MVRKKNKIKKEEIAEDWCFECMDGGKLRVCDYRGCLKAYHPDCVGKDDSFLEENSYWTCRSHLCHCCGKTSKFWCLCCPNAVCGNCINLGEFAVVKGRKGFCRHCSKLAFLIEENAGVDSDGENVDFKDRETYECLFSEYYEIIKKEEGLNSQHVQSARNFLKNSKNKTDLDLDEIAEVEDDSGESEDGSDFEVSEKTQNCLAAIVSSNVKLVYLKRSLLEELLKQPKAFDSKVFGSFVRIKSDSNNNFQKNSHLLVQVKGINRSSQNDENNKEILLQLSHVPKDVPICKISDDDFTEEECQDLYQRMRNGLLKQPTKLELEQKARSLHEDIIKHWIPRELAFLQNRIDWANEKRQRRKLSEYLDRRTELENPHEQARLLRTIPRVIPEEKLESDGCSSKQNGFGHCPNKREDIAVENDMDPSDLMTQILAIQEQHKQKVDHDVEQAKDQENHLTTLVADGTGKQNGAPDSGATDNSEGRIDFTPEANILEKGTGSSTVPDPTIIDNRKRKNPKFDRGKNKIEPVMNKKTKAEKEKMVMENTKAAELSTNDIRRLTTKLTDAEQERDKLAEKVKTLSSKVGILEEEVVGLKTKCSIAEEEVVGLKTKCSIAESFATSAAAAFEEKKKEAGILLEKNESAESSLESMKKEVDNLTSLLLGAAKGAFDNAVNQLRILNPGLNIEGAASDRVARDGQICLLKEGKFIPCPDVHPTE